jgi:membrane associated rhomboid family serine protease
MQNSSHTIRQELHGVLLFVGAIWGVFAITLVWPSLREFGLVPRSVGGLMGILTMPLLHEGWQHILSNTPTLLILLALLAGSRASSWRIVAGVILLSGALLWTVGRPANHIGASALIFGLIVFLIVSGLLERRVVPLMIAVLVGFLFGGALLGGVLPRFGSNVSWDGHLCGAIAGGLVAYALTARPRSAAKPYET